MGISCCLRPDAILGLDKDLKMPNIKFKTTTPVSEFGYVEKLKKADIKTSGALKKAVLSKSTKQSSTKKADEEKEDSEKKPDEDKKMDVDSKESDEKEEIKTHELANPSRVTKAQRTTVESVLGDRYEPVFGKSPLYGVVILRDKKPDEEKKYVDTVVSNKGLQPPADFKYRDPLLL